MKQFLFLATIALLYPIQAIATTLEPTRSDIHGELDSFLSHQDSWTRE